MVLAYSNITVELKEISLRDRPQELYDISSKGTVPVLYISKLNVIDESLDIMKWALKENDPDYLYNDNINTQDEMIRNCDYEFKVWLDKYKYFERYPEHDQSYYKNKCGEYLSMWNNMLIDNKYLLSDNLSLVDIALFPFIRQCAAVDQRWFEKKYFYLSSCLKIMTSSKLFVQVMSKYNQYIPGQNPLIINFNEMIIDEVKHN